MSAATEDAQVGHPPRSPERLSLSDWRAALKRSFSEFMKDDCMGLAQQIAFSSLLAFFPAMILLVGLLGLIGAYEDLKEFLGVVAPGAVIDAIDTAQESAAGQDTAASFAVIFGAFGSIWAASGAMNSVAKAVNAAYDRRDAALLEGPADLDRARPRERICTGRALPADRLRRADRRGDRR